MAQTDATAERGRLEAMHAARGRVGNEALDSTIRSRYKAVRSATSVLAANVSAEDQRSSRVRKPAQ